MIQTVREKNRYMTPEIEALEVEFEPIQGFCSDTRPIIDDPDDEIPGE